MLEPDKVKFYIHVASRLISVRTPHFISKKPFIVLPFLFFQLPQGTKAMNVFDYFLKIHKLFNVQYNADIRAMMIFMEIFIYKMDPNQCELTERVRELAINFEPLFD